MQKCGIGGVLTDIGRFEMQNAATETCHCDSKRVYAEMNNDGEKIGKRVMRGNKNPAEPWGLRDENCILLILLVVSRGVYPVIWQKFR